MIIQKMMIIKTIKTILKLLIKTLIKKFMASAATGNRVIKTADLSPF